MATEVLRPQDLLAERFHHHPASFHRRRVFPASTGNLTTLVVNRKQQQQHRKTSPPPPKKRSPAKATRSNHHHHHHHHQNQQQQQHGSGVPSPRVTLLRRGESLSSIAAGNPIGNPVSDLSAPKQIRLAAADIYAGSAFSMSPSPRSVPLPSFFGKKDSNDGATRDLRRLLRLE